MQSWPYLMKYHEAPNYVCKIISSSTIAKLLDHLDESDPKIYYQSHLLSPSWSQYTLDTLNQFTFPKTACFIRSQGFVLVLPSSWEVLPPGVHSVLNFLPLKASSDVTSSVKLPQPASLLKHLQSLFYYFVPEPFIFSH